MTKEKLQFLLSGAMLLLLQQTKTNQTDAHHATVPLTQMVQKQKTLKTTNPTRGEKKTQVLI